MLDVDTFLTALYVIVDDFCSLTGFNNDARPRGLLASGTDSGGRAFPHQVLDASAMPGLRDAKRRGSGWLA